MSGGEPWINLLLETSAKREGAGQGQKGKKMGGEGERRGGGCERQKESLAKQKQKDGTTEDRASAACVCDGIVMCVYEYNKVHQCVTQSEQGSWKSLFMSGTV